MSFPLRVLGMTAATLAIVATVPTLTTGRTRFNDPPVAHNGVASGPYHQVIRGFLSASDPDGDPIWFGLATPPAKGTATIDAVTGAFTYTSNPFETAYDSFAFSVYDGQHVSTATQVVIPVAEFPRWPGQTFRASVGSGGIQGIGDALSVKLSANGRYVAFASSAPNLVLGDNNGGEDIFVLDRESGETERVSVASDGSEANSWSSLGGISADGRYVSFVTSASNLAANDTNGYDVFLHDRETHQTERVSVASGAGQANNDSVGGDVSADGRYVVFSSWASNLVADDNNFNSDIFVRDRWSNTTTRVSVASDGSEADAESFGPSMSADGRYIAFHTNASNLVPGDANFAYDVFVHDRVTGQTERVSIASDGTEGGWFSESGAISADGRHVAFISGAINLVADDTNGVIDVFLHDRQTHQTVRVSVADGGNEADQHSFEPSVSADGRYVVFRSDATNLVTGDSNDASDVFVHDTQTGRTTHVNVRHDGGPGDAAVGSNPAISTDGQFIAFKSSATDLVSGDTNGVSDVFVVGGVSVVPTEIVDFPAEGTNGTVSVQFVYPGTRWNAVSNDPWITLQGETSGDGPWGGIMYVVAPNAGPPRTGTITMALQTVTIYQDGGNSAPTAENASVPTFEDTAVSGQLLAADADSDALTFTLVAQGAKGTVVITNASTGEFTYTPNLDANGDDSFTFAVSDGQLPSEVATVTIAITAVNDSPVAANALLSTNEDALLIGTLPAVDVDGPALDFAIVANGTKGTAIITDVTTGAFTYAPNANANGGDDDSFTYKVNDGAADSNVATVFIAITAVNDPPIAHNGVTTGPFHQVITGVLRAKDADDDSIGFHLATPPTRGTVTIDAVTGEFTYTPNMFETRYDSFTFDVYDGQYSSSATQVVIPVAEFPRWPGQTVRASASADGLRSGGAEQVTLSANGRFVVFESASALIPDDTNSQRDIYLHDRESGQIERVSVSSSGAQANNESSEPAISADGQYVAFNSTASNLAPGANGHRQIYVRDRQANTTTLVSKSSSGAIGNFRSHHPTISADGRYVAFYSVATTLVDGDANGWQDIFVHDRHTSQTTRVLGVGGAQPNNDAWDPEISGDGQRIAFWSSATNMAQGDTDAFRDVFVHDRVTGSTVVASVRSGGVKATGTSTHPHISADGRYVAFVSIANLVSNDTNGVNDIYVHDLVTRDTARVSVASGGVQATGQSHTAALSADGRYVTFSSEATNLATLDSNATWDVFVHDRLTGTTRRVSVDGSGAQANGASAPRRDYTTRQVAISGDGQFIAFRSDATNLDAGDSNAIADIFVVGGVSVVPAEIVGFPAEGTNGTVSVQFLYPGTPWTAVSNDPWITLQGETSGVADGSIMYVVARNSGPARTGTLTAAAQTVTISQEAPATPTIIWNNPPDITYGTPLSGTQLNATADVAGTFTYTPASGAILRSDIHTLTSLFSPTDPNYASVNTSVILRVQPAPTIIRWTPPTHISYGQPLNIVNISAESYAGAMFVPSTCSYSPVSSTILPAGTHTVSVTCTPTDSNYAPATTTRAIEVAKALPPPMIRATVTETWQAGPTPTLIAVNEVLQRAYVSAGGNDTLTVIDTQSGDTMAALNVPVGSSTSFSGLAVDSQSGRVYVAGGSTNALSVIDGATNTALSPVSLQFPYAVAVDTAGRRLFVSGLSGSGPVLRVLDADTLSVVQTYATPVMADGLAFNAASGLLYFSNGSVNNVFVIDSQTGATVSTVAVGQSPRSVAVNASSNRIYVTNGTSHSVTVIDGATHTTVSTIYTPVFPIGLAVNEVANRIYVGIGSNRAAIIDGERNAVIDLLTVGLCPFGIAADRVTKRAYFANQCGGGSVSVIDDTASTVSWPTPASIVAGSALSSTQLNAAASVPGTFVYTPPAGTVLPVGQDHTLATEFTPANVNFLTAKASIFITVTPSNTAPTAEDDFEPTFEDTALSGQLVGADAEGDVLTFRLVAQGDKGTAIITNASTGEFTYTPNLNANGSDSFGFEVTDGQFTSNVATVTIAITAVNDAPVITNAPDAINAEATGPDGAVVTWPPPLATDVEDGDLAVTCSPASGTPFPLTMRTVTCSAVDAAGNSSLATFDVTVRDTTPPAIEIGLNADSLVLSSPVAVRVGGFDAVGITAVTVNNVAARLIERTAQNGWWVADAPATVPGAALSFTATATDASGNTSSATVTFDNDGIRSSIDKNRTTLVDESAVFSSEFVYGATRGTIERRPVLMSAAPVAGTTVALNAFGVYDPAENATAGLCDGSSKWVDLNTGEAADAWCSGAGNHTMNVRSRSGVIEVWRYDGFSCGAFECSHYYTHVSLPSGSFTSLGSPVTAAPENPGPLHVELVRVVGGETEPEIGSSQFATAEVFGSFDLDASESLDVVITPSTESADDRVQVVVLSGTITVTIAGQTQTVDQGEEAVVTIDSTPPVIGPAPDLIVEATSAAGATVNYALPSVTDNVDASPIVNALPPAGSMFPIGETIVTVTATDLAGNSNLLKFKVTVRDTIAPVATPAQVPPANDAGWNRTPVIVNWNWSDGGTGLDAAQCTTSSAASTSGEITLSATCRDLAGNVSSAARSVRVDLSPPTIQIATPANGTSYTLHSLVPANFACADQAALSGNTSCSGTVANGNTIDTSSVGSKTFTVTSTDAAGHVSTISVSYVVRYDFAGFFQPIDNLPVKNLVTAGQAVPVTFALGGNQGMSILASGSPSSLPVSCNSGDLIDEVEHTVPAGSSNLSYDSATATYTYVWKTQKAWGGTCRQLNLRLADGTEHIAHFKLK